MTALHQTRLIAALGAVAAVIGILAALLGRAVEPSTMAQTAAVHVVWALVAGLGQLLAQSWIALFGWGTMRLLARRGRPPTRAQRVVVLGAPLLVVILIAVTIWIGIQAYAAGGISGVHAGLGWATAAATLLALALEWRVLEAVDRAMAQVDRESSAA